jgi:hypothetical protein
MTKTTCLVLTCLLMGGRSISQTLSAASQAQLEKTEISMFDATANGDSSAFRKLCSENYLSINADGSVQNLEQSVMNVPRFKGSTYKLSDQQQRIYGSVALRAGRAKFYFGTQQVAEIFYTAGWLYQNNQWVYIHWQGTFTGMSTEGKGMKAPPPLK